MSEAIEIPRAGSTPALEELAASLRRGVGARFAAISVFSDIPSLAGQSEFGDAVRVPAQVAPCIATLESGNVFKAQDLSRMPRFAENPFVNGAPFVKSYLGSVIRRRNQDMIGTICAFDPVEREFSPEDESLITLLAKRAAQFLEFLILSDGIKHIHDYHGLIGAVDRFAILGYPEVARCLLSMVFFGD